MIRRLLIAAAAALLFSASASAQDPTASASLSSTACPGAGCLALTNLSNRAMATVEVSGTWSGTLLVEITGSWTSVPVFAAGSRAQSASITANGTYLVPMGGASSVRVRASALSSGTAVVRLTAGQGSASFELPAGAASEASLSALNGKVTAVNTGAVVVTSSALPAGAATETTLSALNGKVTAVNTGAVVVSSSALPAGAATSAGQTTGNSSLSSIDSKTPALGQALAAASIPVVLTAAQIGALTPLSSVAVSNFPATQPVSAAALPLPTGAATEASVAKTASAVQAVDDTVSGDNAMMMASWETTTGGTVRYLRSTNAAPGASDIGIVTRNIPSGTQSISATSLPLPDGAATAIKQDTANSSLESISIAVAENGGNLPQNLMVVGGLNTSNFPNTIAIELSTADPNGDENAVIVRNIPSGIQEVRVVEIPPLPAGAATAAKQPALGTAGTPSADVLTVQGAATMTALKVDGSGVTQPVSAASLPLPTGAATASNQTNGSQVVKLVDASNPLNFAAIKSANTQPISTDKSLVVTVSPNSAPLAVVPSDGTNVATVKPASTAAGATDTALVVAISPNNTVGVTGTFWPATQPVSGTVTANAGTNLNTSALALDATLTGGTQKTKIVDTAGTNVATVSAAGALKVDASAVTQPVSGTFFQATQPVSSTQLPAALAANGGLKIEGVAGGVAIPASLTTLPALTAGSAVIGHVIADSGSTTAVTGTVASNQTQVNGVAVSVQQGVADTGTQRMQMAQEATYAAGTTAKTATAAGTAPFFNICGSASKTIRIQRVSVSGTVATAAVWGDIVVKKTSSAATGGTATTLTNAPYDSSSAAATATAKYFTVLPTAGASVGVVFTATQLFPVTAISATLQPTPAPLIYLWRDQDAEAPTLRGTAQCIEMSFGTTPTNAPTLSVSVAWTEK